VPHLGALLKVISLKLIGLISIQSKLQARANENQSAILYCGLLDDFSCRQCCATKHPCFKLSRQVKVMSFNIRYNNPDDGLRLT